MVKKIRRPNRKSFYNGMMNISPIDILPFLPPPSSYFFDSRHWVYDTTDGIMPFAVTTRISANSQQYLLTYEETR